MIKTSKCMFLRLMYEKNKDYLEPYKVFKGHVREKKI